MLEEAIETIERNLAAQEEFLRKYKNYNPAACQSRLGKAYQDASEVLQKGKGKTVI